ncbi:MAG: hypothetical protein DWQ09_04795 [Proteobacteria bacterium]|nr:MAG: hypothetical protein DWQ09_04795 [Pseudomonadota bacterium]QKK11283.1 MAG: hypothetical protein HND59_06450 [Pseudomonadota bacterium]
MADPATRDYCLRHPRQIIRIFGLGVYLRMMLDSRKSLLEAVSEAQARHGIALPGQPGNAYRIASVIEFRVARIYGLLAQRFTATPALHEFYRELQAEEEEHGRLMLLCMYTATNAPLLGYIPTLRDHDIRQTLRELRSIQAKAPQLTLDEALAVTEELEMSEINTIFEKLLAQTQHPATYFFRELMGSAEGHAESVPRRIRELRASLGLAGN